MKHKKLMGLALAASLLAGAVPGALAADPVQESVKNGLVLHMDFNDAENIAKDSSGQDTQAAVTGATSIDGVGSKGLQFSGDKHKSNSNRIEITNRDDLKFAADEPYSIVVWLNISNMSDSNLIGNKNWEAAKNPGFCLAMNSTNLRWVTPKSDTVMGETQYNYSSNNNKEKWTQVAMISSGDGSDPVIYINGNEQAFSGAGANGSTINASPKEGNFCIGADYNGQYGPGTAVKYDELRVYNRVLSSDEINYLKNDDLAPKNLEVAVEGTAVKGVYNSAKAVLKANIIYDDETLKRSTGKISVPKDSEVSWKVSDDSVKVIATETPAVIGFDIPADFSADSFNVTAVYEGQEYTQTVTVSQTPDAKTINGLLDGLADQVKLALDFEGNVNGATVTGSPEYTEGETGQAILFKNNNGSVQIPNDTSAENTLKDRTITFSMKSLNKHNYASDPVIMATNGWGNPGAAEGSGGFVWAYSYSGCNLMKFRGAKNNTEGIGLYQDGTYNENVWEHYAVSFTDAECKFYKDGVLVKTLDTSELPTNWYDCVGTQKVLSLGDDISGNYGKYDKANQEMAMDNFRIYDKVLTGEEVYAVHAGRQEIPEEPEEKTAVIVDITGMTDESGKPIEVPAGTYVFGAEAQAPSDDTQVMTGVDFKFTAKNGGETKNWVYDFGQKITGGATVKAAAILYNAPEDGVDCTYTPVYEAQQ